MLEKGYIYPQKGNTFLKCIGRWVFFWVCFPNFSVLTLWSMCSVLPASSVWYALHLHRKILCKDHHVQFPSRRVFKPMLQQHTFHRWTVNTQSEHGVNAQVLGKVTYITSDTICLEDQRKNIFFCMFFNHFVPNLR